MPDIPNSDKYKTQKPRSAQQKQSYTNRTSQNAQPANNAAQHTRRTSSSSSSGIGSFVFIIVCICLGIALISGLSKSANNQNSQSTQQYATAPYQAPAPVPEPSQVNITKAVIAEGLDSNQVPVGINNSFFAGDKTLYYYVSYTGAIPNETTFVYRWYKDDNEIQNSQFTLTDASGNAWNSAAHNFEPGAYEVRLYANNQELERTVFNVETISDDNQRMEQQRQQEADRLEREAEDQRRQKAEEQLAAEQKHQREAEDQQRENARRQLAESQWRQRQAEQQRRQAEMNQILQRNQWQAEQRRQRQLQQQQRRVYPLYPTRNYYGTRKRIPITN